MYKTPKKKHDDEYIGTSRMDLSGQDITTLSINLRPQLTSLRSLVIHNSGLTVVPVQLLPRQLVLLDLSYNSIDRIAPLDHLMQLAVLHLEHNNIRYIEGLQYNKQLEEVSLSHNNIYKIDNGLIQCNKLSILNLDHNPLSSIKSIEVLTHNTKLTTLNLTGTTVYGQYSKQIHLLFPRVNSFCKIDLANSPIKSNNITTTTTRSFISMPLFETNLIPQPNVLNLQEIITYMEQATTLLHRRYLEFTNNNNNNNKQYNHNNNHNNNMTGVSLMSLLKQINIIPDIISTTGYRNLICKICNDLFMDLCITYDLFILFLSHIIVRYAICAMYSKYSCNIIDNNIILNDNDKKQFMNMKEKIIPTPILENVTLEMLSILLGSEQTKVKLALQASKNNQNNTSHRRIKKIVASPYTPMKYDHNNNNNNNDHNMNNNNDHNMNNNNNDNISFYRQEIINNKPIQYKQLQLDDDDDEIKNNNHNNIEKVVYELKEKVDSLSKSHQIQLEIISKQQLLLDELYRKINVSQLTTTSLTAYEEAPTPKAIISNNIPDRIAARKANYIANEQQYNNDNMNDNNTSESSTESLESESDKYRLPIMLIEWMIIFDKERLICMNVMSKLVSFITNSINPYNQYNRQNEYILSLKISTIPIEIPTDILNILSYIPLRITDYINGRVNALNAEKEHIQILLNDAEMIISNGIIANSEMLEYIQALNDKGWLIPKASMKKTVFDIIINEINNHNNNNHNIMQDVSSSEEGQSSGSRTPLEIISDDNSSLFYDELVNKNELITSESDEYEQQHNNNIQSSSSIKYIEVDRRVCVDCGIMRDMKSFSDEQRDSIHPRCNDCIYI